MGIHHHIPGLGRKLGNHIKKSAQSYTPKHNPSSGNPLNLIEKGAERNIDNLWTGYKRNYKGKAATGAVALGATVYLTATASQRAVEQRTDNYVQQQSLEGNVESLISTRGDESGYSVNMQRLSDLQSQGDLVFALNRLRN